MDIVVNNDKIRWKLRVFISDCLFSLHTRHKTFSKGFQPPSASAKVHLNCTYRSQVLPLLGLCLFVTNHEKKMRHHDLDHHCCSSRCSLCEEIFIMRTNNSSLRKN